MDISWSSEIRRTVITHRSVWKYIYLCGMIQKYLKYTDRITSNVKNKICCQQSLKIFGVQMCQPSKIWPRVLLLAFRSCSKHWTLQSKMLNKQEFRSANRSWPASCSTFMAVRSPCNRKLKKTAMFTDKRWTLQNLHNLFLFVHDIVSPTVCLFLLCWPNFQTSRESRG